VIYLHLQHRLDRAYKPEATPHRPHYPNYQDDPTYSDNRVVHVDGGDRVCSGQDEQNADENRELSF
jgi:hypothetical protein